MSDINQLHADGAFDKAVASKFSNYNELEKFLNGDPRHNRRNLANAFVTVDYIEALNVDIVVFNTAVLSTGGNKAFDRDEGLLIVPEYAVIEAVKALQPSSYRIFITHHPMSHLTEQSAKFLEGEIARNSHLHLFGHMHDPQPKKITGLKGEVVTNQAGAVFTARKDYYNGYTLLTLDRRTNLCEALVRSYFKERSEFDDGVDIIKGGKWWSSDEARTRFYNLATPVDEQLLRDHLGQSALADLIARERETEGGSDIHQRFVAPPLRRTFINETVGDESKVEVETPVEFSEMVEGDANLIVYGRSEYGRTTLLKELRYRFLSNSQAVRFPRVPVMIDFRDISSNVDNVLRIVRGASETVPLGSSIEALLQLGHACILVDDVIFSEASRMRVLRDFVRKYPKSRYVFSSPQHSATKLGACIDPEMPLRFEFVEIREFRRSDMRQLLQKEERCTNVEDWLDRLQNEFKEINLPFTAANGSIFIEILSEKYNFTPINRSVLMEQFVDSTLRKAAIEQSKRETFDYTNKTDLLSHLAAWMAKTGEYAPAREVIRQEMKSYLDSLGLNVALGELLREFLFARILVENSESHVCFRYRGVMEYFVALRMSNDTEFRAWVLHEDRYLQFASEISYYAGKVRNDVELLDLIAERHKKIFDEVMPEIGPVNLADFDGLILPADKKTDNIDVLEHVIGSAPISKEEKDEELKVDDYDDEDVTNTVRTGPRTATDRLTSSLILYANLVKNLELITDVKKREHLGPVWVGWSTLLMLSLRLAPRLAKARRVRIGTALYEVQAPQGMHDTVLLRKMMLLLPHIHIRMLASALGTEKLDRQLTEPTLDEAGDHKIIQLLRAGVISELKLDATPTVIGALAGELSHNFYLLWSLLVHVGELRRLDRVREEHFSRLELPMANAIADLRGGSVKAKAVIKRQQIARLGRERLMISMKRERDRRS